MCFHPSIIRNHYDLYAMWIMLIHCVFSPIWILSQDNVSPLIFTFLFQSFVMLFWSWLCFTFIFFWDVFPIVCCAGLFPSLTYPCQIVLGDSMCFLSVWSSLFRCFAWWWLLMLFVCNSAWLSNICCFFFRIRIDWTAEFVQSKRELR